MILKSSFEICHCKYTSAFRDCHFNKKGTKCLAQLFWGFL